MADYHPQGLMQNMLARLEQAPGFVGRSARRKLKRRYKTRALAAFDAVVAGLGPQHTCLDLGANVGEITRILAATGARVHAFEPDPDTFALLQAATADLANVTLHPAAIGAQAGTVTLRRAADFPGRDARNTLGSSVVFDDARMVAQTSVQVQQLAFRDVLTDLGPVSLIKMDIEGSELAILDDLFRAMPTGFDRMFVETHENLYPAQRPQVLHLRAMAARLAQPDINLYWK